MVCCNPQIMNAMNDRNSHDFPSVFTALSCRSLDMSIRATRIMAMPQIRNSGAGMP